MESSEKLIAAAKAGDEQTVAKLLDEGADITSSIELGITGLHYSAKEGHESVVRTFLEYGIDVNIRPNTGRRCTALIYAAEEGHLSIVQLLLDHGADLNITDTIHNHTAMVWAVRRKCYGMDNKKNYNSIIAELLSRRTPHDHET